MTDEVDLAPSEEPAAAEHPETNRALKLRAWGFLATALGGLLAGVGALLPWAKITQFVKGYNSFPGTDFWQGVTVLVLGLLIVIVVFAMRFQRTYERRRLIGRFVIVAAVGIVALLGVFVVRADSQVLNLEEQASTLVEGQETPELLDKVLAELQKEISLEFQYGLAVSFAGALFALLGAFVSLRWARVRATIQQDEGEAFGAPKGSVPDPAS